MPTRQLKIAIIALATTAVLLGLVFLAVTYVPKIRARQQDRQLQANYRKWQDQDITHYRYSVHISCFCPLSDNPMITEVRDGKIVRLDDGMGNVYAIDSNYNNFPEQLSSFKPFFTIDGLAMYLAEAFRGADEACVEYDPQFGFPSSIFVDWSRDFVDDEIGILVTDFETLP